MKKSAVWPLVIVIVVILGAWYYFSGQQGGFMYAPATDTNMDNQEDQSREARTPATVTVASDSVLGDYLVAANGMTLYLFTKDTAGTSNCYDACAVNWPPYVPAAIESIMADVNINGQLSVITRTDGSSQLAYNGTPLYFWKDDKKPGDTTGQNFGGVWFVVKP